MDDYTILNPDEIKEMREGGKIWQLISKELKEFTKAGVTGAEVNNKAKELFDKHRVETAFYLYHNFPGHICISVNDCIIHGVGHDITFKSGDKVTLDIGFKHKSIFIDSAMTLIIDPDTNSKYVDFIEHGHKALWAGIKAVRPKCTQGDIAYAIEKYVIDNTKYAIIDGFVGHTIGKEIHLKPNIYNKGLKPGQGMIIKPGTVICVEPMLLDQDTGEHRKGENGFDIFSKKVGSMTCHWEHMVLVMDNGIEVLTASEEEIKKYLG
ncbi:type I methionyl aminopeptidase [Candidatus Mycoplasma haematobovis]|uniref:Methionine aminopeptidase n=1 Tax=Candidatus Mycoplasma haematobovis TaxID=432608 RepID=A0A1A9QEK9_9MOLU|nr:type I methionyl aminopeptidase [Candidatus Mycoplasma haematobovis]OAL10386.1 type I methionyl aminopeptidase [Candidatus Mycoplasma haematobovis]